MAERKKYRVVVAWENNTTKTFIWDEVELAYYRIDFHVISKTLINE